MADLLDAETVERVARWCAEAGRQTTPADIHAALGGLSWDDLLGARALLADAPPARPLGPYALADLARGATVDQAAQREREQRYPDARPPGAPVVPPPGPGPGTGARLPVARSKPAGAPSARARVVVRKMKTAASDAAPPPPLRPLLEILLLPSGRAAIGRLVRRHGGRRAALLTDLAASHRRPDGLAPVDADLDRLLEHHGLTRSYLRRERDELLHAVRAAGGILPRAAAAQGLDAAGLAAALQRLGLAGEVEAIRTARRRDLAGRATLSDRARLLVSEPETLADLGLLETFEADLRGRLPEHLRALRTSTLPLALALARSLALSTRTTRELAARLGLELGPVTTAEASAPERPAARFRPGRADGARPATRLARSAPVAARPRRVLPGPPPRRPSAPGSTAPRPRPPARRAPGAASARPVARPSTGPRSPRRPARRGRT